jgi:hypothetical protein
MAIGLLHYHAWVNILSRAAILFAVATYLVGAATLIFGTLLSLVLLAYQWLRYGIWCTCSPADLLARNHPDESSSWFLKTPMLVTMPSIGSALAAVGIAMLFWVGLPRVHNRR